MNVPNNKALKVLLYYPFGMGDQIICHGMVREYCKQYEHVTIFAKKHNYPSVRFMYRDLTNLRVFEIDKTPLKLNENTVFLDNPQKEEMEFDVIKIIGHSYLIWSKHSIQFEKQLYEIAGLPLLKKWESFFVERDLERERGLFEKVPHKEAYAFLHEDPERKYLIKRELISKHCAVFEPNKNLTENIFDYCTVIENAEEIHVIDSSFMFLIDCLPYENPRQKLFVHRYARDNNESLLPILKKNWTVIVERRDKWEPMKDLLAASYTYSSLPPAFSSLIFKMVRKIFWTMNWNMTRPKHPDAKALIQRYVPGKSFAEIFTDKRKSDDSNSLLARRLEATSTSVIDISSEQHKKTADVVFCSTTPTELRDATKLILTLRSVTNSTLIFHLHSAKGSPVRSSVESILTRAGFTLVERHLYRTEAVFVCKVTPGEELKFSIITPVYNGEKYIKETMDSVLSQEGNFEIEYIIQDGGSTDETIAIVKSYEQLLCKGEYPGRCKKVTLKWYSEKDGGMYDAIEKGFARATGEIFAYINSDDNYLAGAFASVCNIFSADPEVEWIKGIDSTSNEVGSVISPGACLTYRRDWLQKGAYGRSAYFVEQASVFWKKSLWKKACPDISKYRLAGDYALWFAFSQHAPLWSFNKQVSTFRKRAGQLSENMEEYRKEQVVIAPYNFFLEKRLLVFFTLNRFLRLHPKKPFSRFLFLCLFPFQKKELYLDFDNQGHHFKKKADSYVI
ncbi:MAG: glycosyltransferase family 2 protein [bacterium]